ncbi:MAG: HDIG domain-containing protein [Chloroflexi bacterium]|nr:HDIG domain-containing protein [Chloroflexota bacterium]
MLTRRVEEGLRFTRRDAGRLGTSAAVLVVVLTLILGIDILSPQPLALTVGDVARADIVAPRAISFESAVQTETRREEARAGVPPQYDYTPRNAAAVAADQLSALRRELLAVEAAFDSPLEPAERRAILSEALPGLTVDTRATLLALNPGRWPTVRAEAERVLDLVERAELRDADVAPFRQDLAARMSSALNEAERQLAAEMISPFIVANSSFSLPATEAERSRRAELVAPVQVSVRQGQAIVRSGDLIDPADLEIIEQLGLLGATPDVARLAGWFLLATLVVGLLLAWVWRFRRDLWHRNNVLILVGVLLVFAAFALKVTAGRQALPFLIPTAAVGMLVAILLDAGAATVLTAVLAVVAGAVNGASLEVASYVFLGGFGGIVAIRRGDRLQTFLQAGIAVFIVQAMVVSAFSLLGTRDLRGIIELWGASALSGGGAAVAAVGSFAVLGHLFGILTSFQLLELANPSQPLLRRLLVETPGTYHHSLMVGNLAERAAEAIGADPLLTRVAAYYHDIGKLANPLAFIENQAGGDNIHDQLQPEVSAQVLKQHVADGIDLAYRGKLPKVVISFIPQHHGTAVMSYFHARARAAAAAPFGGLETAEGRAAADKVDQSRFRHAGPKPQSREAALIMLADGVEASVRSLSARDEPAIRAMVSRIIEERLADGQFDECDLTLRDVDRIKDAFVGQLLGMYHTRIAYPQNKVVELESRRAAGGGPSAS